MIDGGRFGITLLHKATQGTAMKSSGSSAPTLIAGRHVLFLALVGASGCSGSNGAATSNETGGLPSAVGGAVSGGVNSTGGTSAQGRFTGGSNATGGASNNVGGSLTSSGGLASTGGNLAAGGASNTGGNSGTGAAVNTGGSTSTGGALSSGGNVTTGGSNATGGMAGVGGTLTTGGSKTTGGNASTSNATGGKTSTGGSNATGGKTSTGGTNATGGSASTGGSSSSGGALNACGTTSGTPGGLPSQSDVLALIRLANTYYANLVPDPTQNVTTNPVRASTLWTRAVYFEGLMGLYGIETDSALKTGYYNYAVTWGAAAAHPWQLYGGANTTRDANSQCCGQTYIDLYNIDTSQTVRIQNIKADIDAMTVAGSSDSDWTWVDAIQMAMPVFAKLGAVYTTNTAYFTKMYSMYVNTKTTQGLYDSANHLWWRDATFKPPSTTQCYWSRGNGWVFAALTRVLDTIPTTESHRGEYIADFTAMAGALKNIPAIGRILEPKPHGSKYRWRP